jgi:hypothetical protein
MHIDFTPPVAPSALPPRGHRQRNGKAGSAAFAWGAVAALSLGGPAHAETSPWYLGASQNVTHDSNVLRLAAGQETPAGYSRADNVLSTALLAGLDQPFGRQRLYSNLTLRTNRYRGNPRFNNTSYSALVGLDWSTVERISGSLAFNANRALQSFSTDLFTTERATNLESTESLNGSINVGLVTEYSLVLSGGHVRVHNSLQDAGIKSREFNQDNAEVGLRWRPSAATSIGLSVATTQGRYPKFTTQASGEYQADRYTRNDVVLALALQPTGASRVDLRIANGKTTYDLNQRRDFSGVTGSVAWSWQVTGKVNLNSSYARDTGQDSYIYAVRSQTSNSPITTDYSRVTSTLRLRASYEATAKIGLTAGVNYYSRDLVNTINDPSIPFNASGQDRTTTLSLGGRWAPRRYGLLGCDVSSERRKGNGPLTSDLTAKTLSCFGQFTLQ